jgi:hypothetical protein
MKNKTSILLILALLLISLPIFASKTAMQEATSDTVITQSIENTITESKTQNNT